jgi:two-component system, NtrC family, nitrogen regulation response regulator NtrX
MSGRILVVDDEPNIRRVLSALLRSEGYEVEEAGSGNGALLAVQHNEPDAILLDLLMPPGPTGLETLGSLRDRQVDSAVIMMSGKAQLSDAVRATQLGAFQFLEKPLGPEAVLVTLRSALELRRTQVENRALRAAMTPQGELVGRSGVMDRVREQIAQVAPTEARVLVTGESGTGKELVAAAIHRMSRRAGQPFVTVNCAAIPRDLVESEMFGHERGAFTGATDRRIGRFELASGGTLFLDEIGDLSLEAQAKLLRTLETGELQRLGAERSLRVNVRLIAATNRNLEQAVAAGGFREDLYFRINVFPVPLPPLRDRLEDLPLLVQHFGQRLRPRNPPQFTAGALATLATHRWPGNIRELANLVERLAILGRDPVEEDDVRLVLPAQRAVQPADAGAPLPPLSDALDDYERGLIAGAMARADGNVAEAARLLQTDRANLYRRMRRLGLREAAEGE